MAGIIFIIIAYLLGSLSSAILVCKLMNLGDPRTEGSKNPGATNVLRMAGKQAAMITLAGDILKGFVPVLLARLVGVEGFMLGLVATAALLGHVFPVFFEFKGGKGVATALGGILGLSFIIGLLALTVWIIVAALFRYSSLASLVSTCLAGVFILFTTPAYFIPVAIMLGIIIWRHWANIQRLQANEEPKIDLGG